MYSHCYIILVSYQNPQPPSPPTRDPRSRITTLPGGRALEKCSECDIHALFLCSGCRKVWYCSANCQVGTSPTPPSLHIRTISVADPWFTVGRDPNPLRPLFAKTSDKQLEIKEMYMASAIRHWYHPVHYTKRPTVGDWLTSLRPLPVLTNQLQGRTRLTVVQASGLIGAVKGTRKFTDPGSLKFCENKSEFCTIPL